MAAGLGYTVPVQPISPIASERLDLVPLRVEDAVEMVAVLADPVLYRYTGGEPPGLAELEERYARQVRGGSAHEREIWLNWVARLHDSGEAIGFVQATVVNALGVADVAWLIGSAWQGRGYASEAARALVGWLQRDGTVSITAHIHPGHAASGRVAAAAGLVPTGELDADGEELWRLERVMARD